MQNSNYPRAILIYSFIDTLWFTINNGCISYR